MRTSATTPITVAAPWGSGQQLPHGLAARPESTREISAHYGDGLTGVDLLFRR